MAALRFATSTQSGSTSTPVTGVAPRRAAAIENRPDPDPMSRKVCPRKASQSRRVRRDRSASCIVSALSAVSENAFQFLPNSNIVSGSAFRLLGRKSQDRRHARGKESQ